MDGSVADALDAQARLPTLRFLTCGSVDDGKSTLIGRLLHDSGRIMDDQLAALARDSAKHGTTGAALDFALLTDGLADERAQGITIDVAWRYFGTRHRRFIVADTPGHVQYTRNMATGASQCDLAVVLVDARQGVLAQTRRHAFIAAMMGIRHVVLAVNKMDLVAFAQDRFEEVRAEFAGLAGRLGVADVAAVPLCARDGDGVAAVGPRLPWYAGPALLGLLESVVVADAPPTGDMRFAVEWVSRPDGGFRGYAGTVAAGTLRAGQAVTAMPSGRAARVARIVTMDGDLEQADAGTAATVVLDAQTDVARGDVLAAGTPVPVADAFDARLLWLDERAMFRGRSYLLRLGNRTLAASIARIHHRIDLETLAEAPAETLGPNEVASVRMSLAAAVPMERFDDCLALGGFILIDRITNATLAVGMVTETAPAAADVTWHRMAVDRTARAALKGQRPAAVWFTGLSGSGKSTIASLVEARLHAMGRHTMVLDGDNVRHGLNRDLGFSEADRIENIRRAAEAARLMTDAGLIVLVSFISPYRSDRAAARERFPHGEFLEAFVDTPVDECRRRDPKGLYARADAGQIRNFTGVDAPYEAPEAPDIRLATLSADAPSLADQVIAVLRQRGVV